MEGSDRDINFTANYLGFLVGEAVRFKNAMLSLSTGIANSNIELSYPLNQSSPLSNRVNYYLYKAVSIPVELKCFVLAHNGVGFGVHASKNFLSPSKYSPFFLGFSLVFGAWNKGRHHV